MQHRTLIRKPSETLEGSKDAAFHRRRDASDNSIHAQHLLLQRTIGNQAVLRLMQQKTSSGRAGVCNADTDAGPGAAPTGPADLLQTVAGPADLLAPACAHPGRSRTVNLQPVFLRTSPADTAPTGASWDTRYALAAAVWSKLGVTVGARNPVTIDTPLKTAGSDNQEANQVAALRTAADIEVFCVDNDMGWTGGAITYPVGGGGSSQTVMSDHGSNNVILAHELGHTLGLGHPPTGADANTVMQPTGSNGAPNSTRNTMGNYNRITWPAPSASTCLFPDP